MKIVLGLVLLLLASCFFNSNDESNKFLGNWKVSTESFYLGRDSLIRDSIQRYYIELGFDSTSWFSDGFSKDSNGTEVAKGATDYYYLCESIFCRDTLAITKYYFIFSVDEIRSIGMKNNEKIHESSLMYTFDSDSIYTLSEHFDTSFQTGIYYKFSKGNDTLLVNFQVFGGTDTLIKINEVFD